MTLQESFPPGSPDAEEGFGLAPQTSSSSRVELVLDGHRIVGELRYTGPPRRVVDVLNGIDGAFLLVHAAEIEDLFRPQEQRHGCEVAHVLRDGVLFAVPRSEPPGRANAFEIVPKVPVPAVLALPGFTVEGRVHLVPDMDPRQVLLLGHRNFLPVTEAAVVASQGDDVRWREPVILVNLARAQLYAPNPTTG